MIIFNDKKEKLEVIVEGKSLKISKHIIIFLHGLGTDLHERGIFDNIAEAIKKYRKNITIVRFSHSGFGKSQGDSKKKDLYTMSDDLISIISRVKELNQENAAFSFITYCIGANILALTLAKENSIIPKLIIMIGPLGNNPKENIAKYFESKPQLKVDKNGTWHLPRRDGSTTYLSLFFWESFSPRNALDNMVNLINNQTKAYFIVAKNDEVVKENIKEVYKDLKNINIIELPGNHNFKDKKDRERLIRILLHC